MISQQNFRICCSYLKILGKSDDIYLVYLDKVNVIYKKVNLISIIQSHYNCDIPICKLQPPTDPNCYEAHINVLFKCFGEKASQHESQVLLLTNRNVKCAYSYCEWNNGIVFFRMNDGKIINYIITHTGQYHTKGSFNLYVYQHTPHTSI